jgi:hypothetical protein
MVVADGCGQMASSMSVIKSRIGALTALEPCRPGERGMRGSGAVGGVMAGEPFLRQMGPSTWVTGRPTCITDKEP